MQLVACGGAFALVGLGGDEETSGLPCKPRCDAQLRLAVAGSRVDVIDAVSEKNFERPVGCGLRHPRERRRAEDRPAAPVAGAAELFPRYRIALPVGPSNRWRRRMSIPSRIRSPGLTLRLGSTRAVIASPPTVP